MPSVESTFRKHMMLKHGMCSRKCRLLYAQTVGDSDSDKRKLKKKHNYYKFYAPLTVGPCVAWLVWVCAPCDQIENDRSITFSCRNRLRNSLFIFSAKRSELKNSFAMDKKWNKPSNRQKPIGMVFWICFQDTHTHTHIHPKQKKLK